MRTEDTPQGRANEAILALSYLAHPYRWPVIGWRSDVEQVTVEACQEFFDAYYAPNNMVISVVGDHDHATTLAHLERTFGTLPSSPEIPRNPTKEPEQRGERRAVVNFDHPGQGLRAFGVVNQIPPGRVLGHLRFGPDRDRDRDTPVVA